MITYITDIKDGEKDILERIKFKPLNIIKNDIKDPIKVILPPELGWTTESLFETNKELEHLVTPEDVLDAYVGETWVGSTEI